MKKKEKEVYSITMKPHDGKPMFETRHVSATTISTATLTANTLISELTDKFSKKIEASASKSSGNHVSVRKVNRSR